MRFYLASWVGDGTLDNEYRPNVDAAAWAAIDLRPDVTVQEGRVLVGTDQPVAALPSGVTDLGDALDSNLRTPLRRNIESALGVVLVETTLRGIIAELLILHGQPDLPTRTRWRRLEANRQGRHVIKLLNATIYDAPAVVGTTITDDFNRADSVSLGSSAEGWSWTEVVPDFEIVSNQAWSDTNTNVSARAESDLASDDHYAEADMTWGTGGAGAVFGGTCVRFAPSATTFYRGGWHFRNEDDVIQRFTAGSGTTIASQANTSPAANAAHVRTEADGSSISLIVTPGPGTLSTTDTNITGNLRTGIASFAQLIHTWDNFEAADLAAGGTVALAGSGANAADGTGAFSVDRTLAGSGANAAAGTGEATVTRGLSGFGANASSGVGVLTTGAQVDLAGSGANAATGTGALSVALDLSGHGDAANTGSGVLEATRGLSGSGENASGGTGVLDLTLDLSGAGAVASAGTGDITVTGPTVVSLSGSGAAASQGSGSLDLTRDLAGIGAAAAAGFGTLAVLRALSGAGANASAGSAVLGVGIPGFVRVEASAGGDSLETAAGGLSLVDQGSAVVTLESAGFVEGA